MIRPQAEQLQPLYDIRGKICHLVFELREGADVMDAALLVERRHRFGPHRRNQGTAVVAAP